MGAPAPITAISAQEGNGTLMLTRYADDWVAVWNGSRDRAEEIKAEIKAFLANVLKLKLSEEKIITHIDDGFQFWAIKFRVTNAGQMDSGACFHEYPKGDRRFRDAVKAITQNTFTDEVAAFTAPSGLIRGWETTMLMPQTAV